jgi:hypothetical protein
MTLLIYRVEILKPQSNCREQRLRSSILPFAVGTVASKRMDRLGTFLSNPVVKKKLSQLADDPLRTNCGFNP